jgi:predicted esterase
MLNKLAWVGAPPESARAAVVLVHGRGASAGSMLTLVDEITREDQSGGQDFSEVAFLAPQAPGYTWYPYTFLAPLKQNEPYLSRALHTLSDVLAQLEASGLSSDRVALIGFSQGACLTLEFVARNARRYGGVAGLSGGLIGPADAPRDYPGHLADTPVFLGCSTVDPHIPEDRVLETSQVLERMGAQVTTRMYPNLGHTVNEDEITFIRKMVSGILN